MGWGCCGKSKAPPPRNPTSKKQDHGSERNGGVGKRTGSLTSRRSPQKQGSNPSPRSTVASERFPLNGCSPNSSIKLRNPSIHTMGTYASSAAGGRSQSSMISPSSSRVWRKGDHVWGETDSEKITKNPSGKTIFLPVGSLEDGSALDLDRSTKFSGLTELAAFTQEPVDLRVENSVAITVPMIRPFRIGIYPCDTDFLSASMHASGSFLSVGGPSERQHEITVTEDAIYKRVDGVETAWMERPQFSMVVIRIIKNNQVRIELPGTSALWMATPNTQTRYRFGVVFFREGQEFTIVPTPKMREAELPQLPFMHATGFHFMHCDGAEVTDDGKVVECTEDNAVTVVTQEVICCTSSNDPRENLVATDYDINLCLVLSSINDARFAVGLIEASLGKSACIGDKNKTMGLVIEGDRLSIMDGMIRLRQYQERISNGQRVQLRLTPGWLYIAIDNEVIFTYTVRGRYRLGATMYRRGQSCKILNHYPTTPIGESAYKGSWTFLPCPRVETMNDRRTIMCVSSGASNNLIMTEEVFQVRTLEFECQGCDQLLHADNKYQCTKCKDTFWCGTCYSSLKSTSHDHPVVLAERGGGPVVFSVQMDHLPARAYTSVSMIPLGYDVRIANDAPIPGHTQADGCIGVLAKSKEVLAVTGDGSRGRKLRNHWDQRSVIEAVVTGDSITFFYNGAKEFTWRTSLQARVPCRFAVTLSVGNTTVTSVSNMVSVSDVIPSRRSNFPSRCTTPDPAPGGNGSQSDCDSSLKTANKTDSESSRVYHSARPYNPDTGYNFDNALAPQGCFCQEKLVSSQKPATVTTCEQACEVIYLHVEEAGLLALGVGSSDCQVSPTGCEGFTGVLLGGDKVHASSAGAWEAFPAPDWPPHLPGDIIAMTMRDELLTVQLKGATIKLGVPTGTSPLRYVAHMKGGQCLTIIDDPNNIDYSAVAFSPKLQGFSFTPVSPYIQITPSAMGCMKLAKSTAVSKQVVQNATHQVTCKGCNRSPVADNVWACYQCDSAGGEVYCQRCYDSRKVTCHHQRGMKCIHLGGSEFEAAWTLDRLEEREMRFGVCNDRGIGVREHAVGDFDVPSSAALAIQPDGSLRVMCGGSSSVVQGFPPVADGTKVRVRLRLNMITYYLNDCEVGTYEVHPSDTSRGAWTHSERYRFAVSFFGPNQVVSFHTRSGAAATPPLPGAPSTSFRTSELDLALASNAALQTKHGVTVYPRDCFVREAQMKQAGGRKRSYVEGGHFGDTFFGRHSGKDLAMKQLRNHLLKETCQKEFIEQVNRFIILAGKHENLATILGVAEMPSGQGIITSRYTPLLSFLQAQEVSLGMRFKIASGVACGLEHLNRKSRPCGYLKPSQVLITSGGKPVVTDYWLGTMMQHDTYDRFLEGTQGDTNILYMAPEVLAQKGALGFTEASDVFSYGWVLSVIFGGEDAAPSLKALSEIVNPGGDSDGDDRAQEAPREYLNSGSFHSMGSLARRPSTASVYSNGPSSYRRRASGVSSGSRSARKRPARPKGVVYKISIQNALLPEMQRGRWPLLLCSIPHSVADVVQLCWNLNPNRRPSFSHLQNELQSLSPSF
eukprot:Sspe_Gene.56886::Locus_31257_Transcript_1_1_Confidence_1.000_Length_4835::g.56886::m.56886